MNQARILRTAAQIIKNKIGTVVEGAYGRKFTPEIAEALMNAGVLIQTVELLESLADAVDETQQKRDELK